MSELLVYEVPSKRPGVKALRAVVHVSAGGKAVCTITEVMNGTRN